MRPVFLVALVYVILWRVFELVHSARNERRIVARGGRRVEQDGMGGIVVVHALWAVLLLVEELRGGEPLGPESLRWGAGVVYLLSEILRTLCIVTLGERWNVRVVVLPAVLPVLRGPYRYLKHPNYVAVIVGLAALPLALGRPWALVCVPLKLLVLRKRLRVEETAVHGLQG